MRKASRFENRQPRPSLAGKTVILTGSNSGIGLACAKILPTLGVSRLIISVRSKDKGETAAKPIRQQHPDSEIRVWELDMLSYDSILAFSERCKTLGRIDIAILNAGINGGAASNINPSTKHEEVFQVNYLSTALLSILLLPLLTPKTATQSPGHLTIVGSGTALFAEFANRDAVPLIPSFDKPFTGINASGQRYSVSKLLVQMFVFTLSEHVSPRNVIINTVEPGFTRGTELHREYTGVASMLANLMKRISSRTPEQAAWTYVDASAVKGEESHGSFIMNWANFP